MPDELEHPRRLFRVVAYVGYGWPECSRRELKARNFARADTAARWIDALARRPLHHQLVAVLIADTRWTEIDPATLGPPSAPPEEDEWQPPTE